ncbi:MAG: hypothetical protein KDC10_14545 [Calditrichaeota bacterium]|nr:hypothetical protein [Calditrichota bacterium]
MHFEESIQQAADRFLPILGPEVALPRGIVAIGTVGNVSDMLIHNVRNLLSVISMQSQLIQGTCSPGENASRRLNEIVQQVEAIDAQLGALLRLSGLQPRYRDEWEGFRKEINEIASQIYSGLEILIEWQGEPARPLRDGERALLHHLLFQVLHFLVHHDPGKHPLALTLGFSPATDMGEDTFPLHLAWRLGCALPETLFQSGLGVIGNQRGKAALSLDLADSLARGLGGDLRWRLGEESVLVETTVRLTGSERPHSDDQRDPARRPA